MFHKGSASLGVVKVLAWGALAFGVIASYSSVQQSASIAVSLRDVVETGAGIEAGTLSGVGTQFGSASETAKSLGSNRVGSGGSVPAPPPKLTADNYRNGTSLVPTTKAQRDALSALEKANRDAPDNASTKTTAQKRAQKRLDQANKEALANN